MMRPKPANDWPLLRAILFHVRADRLVAALLVLQARGRVTAAFLATELEVSERTARRDLEALSMAGVPVYSQAGRNGGWSLVGGAKTDLTGLTASEVRALFLLAGPSSTTPELRAALRKLVRALPETFRAEAEAAASAVILDQTGWDRGSPPVPAFLHEIQAAVVKRQRLRLGYARRDRSRGERVVDPLGLVCKRGTWYLVASTEAGRRTFRVDRVLEVAPTGEQAERPEGFDLEASWRQALEQLDQDRLPAVANVLARRELIWPIRSMVGGTAEVVGETGDGRVELVVRGYSGQALARRLAGFGRSVELLGPESVLVEMRALASELAEAYLSFPQNEQAAKSSRAKRAATSTPL